VSDRINQVYASQQARAAEVGKLPTSAATAKPVKLPKSVLAPGTKAVFFGDSWTGGYAAAPNRGFAHVTAEMLGWEADIQGLSGTGYIRAEDKPTYPKRAASLPADPSVGVVIVQGGSNDEGQNLIDLKATAKNTYAALRKQYPKAALVVLAPAPSTMPVSSTLMRIDEVLAEAASESKVAFVSPIKEQWVTEKNVGTVIDVVKDLHPGTEGHKYIAERLVKSLRALAA
jgi:lysophospholipase L1-like esterase